MLAKENRVVEGVDYRAAVRRGSRIAGIHTLLHVRPTHSDEPVRFGFIVTKAVGNAVVRNRVRRRLRAICRESLALNVAGVDIVIRALPASAKAEWTTLHREVLDCIGKGVRHG